jgi:hypothetical protein
MKSTELLLIHHGLLPAYGTDDRHVFEDVLAELIARLTAVDAVQH